MKNVSIVIPTLNAGDLFPQIMHRLQSQSHPPLEIIIVDSGSSDRTLAFAAEFGAMIIHTPRADFDHGLTRNLGIEHSVGDTIMLMTQDAIPLDEHLISRMIGNFSETKVAGVFARQIPRPEHDVLVARNIMNWKTGGATRHVAEITDQEAYERLSPMERYELCVFDNVCSMLRRSTWQEIPFRENAFGEDLDWSKRALEAGWKIVYEPEAAVIHSHGRSAGYEYKRTYMCHRTLYRLFRLETIPERKDVLRCWMAGMKADMGHVWRHQAGRWRKLRLIFWIPFLVYASVTGQYRGARDERMRCGIRQEGV